jgi:hypothetical protein
MFNFPHLLRKLPTHSNLLKPSGIVANVKERRDEASCIERQSIIWEMVRHERRPESNFSHRYSARTKRHRSHRISGTLPGTRSWAAPCRIPSGSSPGVAGVFAEDLIVIESQLTLPALALRVPRGLNFTVVWMKPNIIWRRHKRAWLRRRASWLTIV